MEKTLIFPGGMLESLDYLRQCQESGETVAGASSLPSDPSKEFYPEWHYLPFVNNDNFEGDIISLVKQSCFTRIYTRHPIISRYLKALVEKKALTVTLDTAPFAVKAQHAHALLMQRVAHMRQYPFCFSLHQPKPALGTMEMAALLQHAAQIDGQSHEDKIGALAEIFRDCPPGDVVEIGSFWGRSAFVLAWLAQRYHIGSLLCIDPWENASAIQQESPDHVNDEARAIDFESAFQGFQLNLLPYSAGHINYIRGTSCAANAHYPAPVTTDSFGETIYQGYISCLHIDGNHDYAAVAQDIADWAPLVRPGGWLVIDDYQWAFGDGPQKAADEWLNANWNRVATAFVTGSALFVKTI